MPFATDEVEELGTVYVWPSRMETDLGDLATGDRWMLDAFSGHVGPRTGIAEEGSWALYVVGGD